MDGYRFSSRVLMADVSGGPRGGTGRTHVRLDGWREDDIGQQRDDGGGCATMC